MRPRITTGSLARELMQIFPQITDDMVRRDAEEGLLKTFPRFNNRGWWYVDPDGLPEYIHQKSKNLDIPKTVIRELIFRLNPQMNQVKLTLIA